MFFKNSNISKQKKSMTNKYIYKRNHTEDNIAWFQNKLSSVDWNELLDGIDASSDYNSFLKTFDELYDECIPLKRSKVNRKKTPQSPWIT